MASHHLISCGPTELCANTERLAKADVPPFKAEAKLWLISEHGRACWTSHSYLYPSRCDTLRGTYTNQSAKPGFRPRRLHGHRTSPPPFTWASLPPRDTQKAADRAVAVYSSTQVQRVGDRRSGGARLCGFRSDDKFQTLVQRESSNHSR